MTLPKRKEIKLPLLIVVEVMGGKIHYQELALRVARHFSQITNADLEETTTDGDNKWMDLIQYAGWDLSKEGLIKRSGGIWTITEKGLEQMKREGLKVAESPAPLQPLSRHDDLKKKMVEIGNKLGYNTSTEEGPEYRHDVLWRTTPYRTPSHVVEVCEGGVLAKDFASLIWARENWNASGILIVTNDRDFDKATRQLSGQTQITIVKAETVDNLYELIMTDLDFLNSLSSE